jgi:hypothetical protein
MIYRATKFHKPIIIDLMTKFADESPIDYCHSYSDMEYGNKLLDEIFAGRGAIFLADDYGILMSMILPCIWSDKIFGLHELAWYVTPEKRGGMAGYKLIKEYNKFGELLKTTGRIKYYTMSRLVTSPDMDYSRFGYRKQDEIWIQ